MGQDAQLIPTADPGVVGVEVPAPAEAGGGPGERSAPAWLPTGMALLGFAIIAWTMLRSAKRRGRSVRAQMDVSPRERLERIRETAERERVQVYASDAVELTQRLAAQLDAKAALLEELIAQADERLERLGSAAGTRVPGGRTDDLRPGAYAAGQPSGDPASRLGGAFPRDGTGRDDMTREGMLRDGRERDLSRVHEFRRGHDEEFAGERPDAMRREVFRLADAGVEAEEIARQTEQPIGQVRLILALRSA